MFYQYLLEVLLKSAAFTTFNICLYILSLSFILICIWKLAYVIIVILFGAFAKQMDIPTDDWQLLVGCRNFGDSLQHECWRLSLDISIIIIILLAFLKSYSIL